MTFYIAGAGGFGRETLDALRATEPAEAEPIVFLDDYPSTAEINGIPVCRPEQAGPGTFVVAIANPEVRRRMTDTLLARGLAAAQVTHPRAVIAAGAIIGVGCVILANAFISTEVQLGEHVHVNYNATVGHDSKLDDFVTVLPGANVAGCVMLGAGVTVGSNACVLQGLSIGPDTIVGAGAVVTKNQASSVVVVGVPAQPLFSQTRHSP